MNADSKAARVIVLAQRIAESLPDFFEIRSAGTGDYATNDYMNLLQKAVANALKIPCSQISVANNIASRFDFYFEDEGIVIEIALSLRNPNSEYEKDILKCLLAKEAGKKIDELVFISKPGALTRQAEPYRRAVEEFVSRRFQLKVSVMELQRASKAGAI